MNPSICVEGKYPTTMREGGIAIAALPAGGGR